MNENNVQSILLADSDGVGKITLMRDVVNEGVGLSLKIELANMSGSSAKEIAERIKIQLVAPALYAQIISPVQPTGFQVDDDGDGPARRRRRRGRKGTLD